MKTHCDRCGKDCRCKYHGHTYDFVVNGELTDLRFTYNQWGVTHVCKSCGDVCDKIVGYWGEKKKSDILRLMYYLQSGLTSKPKTLKLYSSLSQAGYY